MVQEIKFLLKIFGIAFFLGMMIDILLGKKFKHAFWIFVIATILSLLISFAISQMMEVPSLISFFISVGVWVSFIGGTRLNYLYEAWREKENGVICHKKGLGNANL